MHSIVKSSIFPQSIANNMSIYRVKILECEKIYIMGKFQTNSCKVFAKFYTLINWLKDILLIWFLLKFEIAVDGHIPFPNFTRLMFSSCIVRKHLIILTNDLTTWLSIQSKILHLQMFSLYDINNEIDVQFRMNTFDHVIFFQCVWIQITSFTY